MADKPRSFRLYTPRQVPVTRLASDYSPEEQACFRESFRLTAERCRRSDWWLFSLAVTGFTAYFLALKFFQNTEHEWICVALFIVPMLGVIFFLCLGIPVMECPACHNRVDSRRLGLFCPECGGEPLKPGTWFSSSACTKCGKTLSRGKHQGYTIHACTHCGVFLDEKGVWVS